MILMLTFVALNLLAVVCFQQIELSELRRSVGRMAADQAKVRDQLDSAIEEAKAMIAEPSKELAWRAS